MRWAAIILLVLSVVLAVTALIYDPHNVTYAEPSEQAIAAGANPADYAIGGSVLEPTQTVGRRLLFGASAVALLAGVVASSRLGKPNRPKT
jgi:hypothetical protein